jgi:hypothetical protein
MVTKTIKLTLLRLLFPCCRSKSKKNNKKRQTPDSTSDNVEPIRKKSQDGRTALKDDAVEKPEMDSEDESADFLPSTVVQQLVDIESSECEDDEDDQSTYVLCLHVPSSYPIRMKMLNCNLNHTNNSVLFDFIKHGTALEPKLILERALRTSLHRIRKMSLIATKMTRTRHPSTNSLLLYFAFTIIVLNRRFYFTFCRAHTIEVVALEKDEDVPAPHPSALTFMKRRGQFQRRVKVAHHLSMRLQSAPSLAFGVKRGYQSKSGRDLRIKRRR